MIQLEERSGAVRKKKWCCKEKEMMNQEEEVMPLEETSDRVIRKMW